jgi:hypothetical protein
MPWALTTRACAASAGWQLPRLTALRHYYGHVMVDRSPAGEENLIAWIDVFCCIL